MDVCDQTCDPACEDVISISVWLKDEIGDLTEDDVGARKT